MRHPSLILVPTLVLSACASGPSPSDGAAAVPMVARTDTVVVVDTVAGDASGTAELEARLARLQLQLLEREAQLSELRRDLDEERQEVVRNMAKLQSQANRAEAASGMAEAEIALQTLMAEAGGDASEESARGKDLLDQAAAEFGKKNYGGAIYLATEARSTATDGQRRLRGGIGGALRPGESLFALPVPLLTVSRSNVRGGPALSFGVDTTLEANTPVTGLSYTNEWVRVSFGESQQGWIFHTLVESDDRRP